MTKESSPLPAFLRLTPKKLAKIKKQQQHLRAEAQTRGRLNPAAQRLQLGMAHETAARSDVEMLQSEKANPKTSIPLQLALARLSDALAVQGRYDEAAETTLDPE